MLMIRKLQKEALVRASLERFVDVVAVHLRQHFPLECRAMGEPLVREKVRQGIASASRHDVRIQQDVCRYVVLAFVLGDGFDADPKLPWAGEILRDESIKSQTSRIHHLYRRAQEHLRAPRGPA